MSDDIEVEDCDDPEQLVDALLAGDRFLDNTGMMKILNDLADRRDELQAEEGPKAFIKLLTHRDGMVTEAIRYLYRSADPKQVPAKYLKHALAHPSSPVFPDTEARARINGPIKGIRAMCLECQGSDAKAVRECAKVNCALWAFRMGKNPFYGKFVESEDESDDKAILAELDKEAADKEAEARGDTETN